MSVKSKLSQAIFGMASFAFLVWEVPWIKRAISAFTGIDFIYEKSGWLEKALNMALNPPPGMALLVAIVGLVLIYWSTKPKETRMSAPVIGMLICVIGLAGFGIWYLVKDQSVTNSPAHSLETHLGLKFGPAGTTPTATDLANVWRWYALQSVVVFLQPDGQRKEIKSWNLFMTFDKPVDVKQVVIDGLALPQYEVKDRDSRSVVVAFLGDILDTSLRVRIDSSVGTKPEPTKSDTPAQIQPPPPSPPPAPTPPHPLTAYEAEKKLPVIDAFLAILQDDMQPTIDDGPRLQTNWWNAIKDPKNNPKYGEELIAYRDLVKSNLVRIDHLRDKNPQYQDVIIAVQQTYWNTVIPAVEKFLIAYQLASTQMKPDAAREALEFMMKEPGDAFGKAIQDFTQWRNTARSRLIEIRRSISP